MLKPRAQSSLGHLLKDSLCPFLYQTQTLQHARSHKSTQTRQISSTRINAEDTVYSPFSNSDGAPQPSKIPAMAPRERGQFDFIRKIYDTQDSLPLDSQLGRPSDPPAIRRSKNAVFHQIEPVPSKDQINLFDTDIRHILPLFARAISDTDFDVDAELGDRFNVHEPYSAAQIRTVVIRALSKIAREIIDALMSPGTAPADILIWRTFETQVLPLIELLRMPHDGRPSDFAKLHELKLSDWAPETIPSCLTQPEIPSETPVLPVVTILYPSAVLLVLRTFGAHLPTSTLVQSILPRVRQLGPTSAMLAQNVHFLNALLKVQWNVYSDLHAIDKLLREFTRIGVMLDEGTLQVVREIKADRRRDFRIYKQNQQAGEDQETANGLGQGKLSRPIEWWKLPGNADGFRKIEAIGYRNTEGWETEIKGAIELTLRRKMLKQYESVEIE